MCHPQSTSQVISTRLNADPMQRILNVVEELLMLSSSLASASAEIINPSASIRVSLSTNVVGKDVVTRDTDNVGVYVGSGEIVGLFDGELEGDTDGFVEGLDEGNDDGANVGVSVGTTVGSFVGCLVGCGVGAGVGCFVGDKVGGSVGSIVGSGVPHRFDPVVSELNLHAIS